MELMTRISELVDLPSWAQVSEKRAEHIHRVTILLSAWAAALKLPAEQTRMFLDAGLLHDSMKDAPESQLREITGDYESPAGILHGPAAAVMMVAHGEERRPLIEAVRYHTIGYVGWEQVGRALYMADFLEPGRKFLTQEREFLATLVPYAFDQVFCQVVRLRLEMSISEGKTLLPETVALWNSLH